MTTKNLLVVLIWVFITLAGAGLWNNWKKEGWGDSARGATWASTWAWISTRPKTSDPCNSAPDVSACMLVRELKKRKRLAQRVRDRLEGIESSVRPNIVEEGSSTVLVCPDGSKAVAKGRVWPQSPCPEIRSTSWQERALDPYRNDSVRSNGLKE